MTPECIRQVERMEEEELLSFEGEGPFTALSVEQLLYAAIKATDVEEVRSVLETTDWDRWLQKPFANG